MIGPGYREKEVKNRLAGEKQRQKKRVNVGFESHHRVTK